VLGEGCVIVKSNGFSQGRIDPAEDSKHDRDGFCRRFPGETGGQRRAGFSFMQDEDRARTFADDQIAFPCVDTPIRASSFFNGSIVWSDAVMCHFNQGSRVRAPARSPNKNGNSQKS
jgi:hypothetical protein